MNMMNMMGMMGMMGGAAGGDASGMLGMGCGMGNMGCGAPGAGCMAGMAGASGGATGMEILNSVLQMVPEGVASETRGFSLRCAVPDRLVFALQGGQQAEFIQEIEQQTGTRIQVSRQISDSAHRALSVTGPLFGTVAAYIRLMKRYLEVEAGAERQQPAPPMGKLPVPAPPVRRPSS